MGFLFFDASRNSALAFLVFGAFLIAQGGVFLQRKAFARTARVMVGAGAASALLGLVLFIVHRF